MSVRAHFYDTDGTELWTARRIAEEFKVAPDTVHSWIRRYPDFPSPVATAYQAKLYGPEEVRAWFNRMLAESSMAFGGRTGEAS